MRKILGCIKRAQQNFNMISDGDVIGVGVSGGKDSLTLLHALNLYRNFAPVSYSLKAITVDMGFESFDLESIRRFCADEQVELIVESTRMGEVIFNERREKNPCSFCSRMRRGILNKICDREAVTKLALGHHGDDMLESFFMSIIFESRINTFLPVTTYDRSDVIQIRPLIYACEKDIEAAAENSHIPSICNPCPASGNTERQKAKNLVDEIENRYPGSRVHMINALCRSTF